ncbi:hypothetical protein [Mycobacterium sp.]|uniref:hypothetical protein n=1 Tax=Mycobacterium sp. TaxID=1785 RepID=UPI003BA972A4
MFAAVADSLTTYARGVRSQGRVLSGRKFMEANRSRKIPDASGNCLDVTSIPLAIVRQQKYWIIAEAEMGPKIDHDRSGCGRSPNSWCDAKAQHG